MISVYGAAARLRDFRLRRRRFAGAGTPLSPTIRGSGTRASTWIRSGVVCGDVSGVCGAGAGSGALVSGSWSMGSSP